MITKMVHASFTVSDMDRSIKFYTDIMGMKLEFDMGASVGGPVCEAVTGCPGVEIRTAFLRIDGGILELVQYSPAGKALEGNKPSDTGSAHVCFKTDNIQEFHQKLLKKGLTVVSEPQQVDEATWIMYFRDPDGIYLEAAQGPTPVE